MRVPGLRPRAAGRAVLALMLATQAGLAHAGRPVADTEPPVIVHTPIAHAVEGETLEVRARITDPGGVFAPAVYFRARGESEYASVPMELQGEEHRALIPGARVKGPLEYFIEAFDELGNGPARKGRPEVPLPVTVAARRIALPETPDIELPRVRERPPPDPGAVVMARPLTRDTPPVEERGGVLGAWWFWALVVGVGAAAGAAVAVSLSTPDAVTVEVGGPDPGAGL
jgi:hypothetical protein